MVHDWIGEDKNKQLQSSVLKKKNYTCRRPLNKIKTEERISLLKYAKRTLKNIC